MVIQTSYKTMCKLQMCVKVSQAPTGNRCVAYIALEKHLEGVPAARTASLTVCVPAFLSDTPFVILFSNHGLILYLFI